MSKHRHQALTEQTLALGMFLEAMFRSRPAPAPARADVAATPQPAPQPATPTPGAGDPFQALLMDVGPVKLAMPLLSLGGVLPWPQCLNCLPGQPPWVLGVAAHQGRQVRVVDTATVLCAEGAMGTAPEYRRLVVLAGGEWGLACRAVQQVVRVGPQDVRRARPSARRPWLAGTSTEHMCALLDGQRLVSWLQGGAGHEAGTSPASM